MSSTVQIQVDEDAAGARRRKGVVRVLNQLDEKPIGILRDRFIDELTRGVDLVVQPALSKQRIELPLCPPFDDT